MIKEGKCGNCNGNYLAPFYARCRHNSELLLCPPCGTLQGIVSALLHDKSPDSYGYREMWEALTIKVMEEEWWDEARMGYEDFIQIQILKSMSNLEEKLDSLETEHLVGRDTPWHWKDKG